MAEAEGGMFFPFHSHPHPQAIAELIASKETLKQGINLDHRCYFSHSHPTTIV